MSVTIVGGGTAGWLTALILHSRLNGRRRPPAVPITLIESAKYPIIGVGEGTLPWIVQHLQRFGLDEGEFIRRCNASFKLGVRFVNWNSDREGRHYSFIHPFGSTATAPMAEGVPYFLAFGAPQGRHPCDVTDSLDLMSDAIRLRRAPRANPAEAFRGTLRYAYHFDASLLAEYLREEAVKRGVEHIVDDVEDVELADDHTVAALRLEQRGRLPVRLVIDCTGFKALILSKYLREPFLSYGNNLLCDRAIPVQIPHADGAPLESCTTATAMTAGWLWQLPLYTRVGTGYVYSSAFIDDDAAALELCRKLGLDADKFEPRVIRMRVGRMRNTWVGNCAAIGLSAAFVEPLEATAIMSIQFAASMLADNFPLAPHAPALRDRFNKQMNDFYDNTRDFILMHYYASSRNEPFWVAARQPSVLSDSLKANLEVWQHRLPLDADIGRPSLFTAASYSICLASKGYFRDIDLRRYRPLLPRRWQEHLAQMDRGRQTIRRLPSCRALLTQIRAGAPAAPAAVTREAAAAGVA